MRRSVAFAIVGTLAWLGSASAVRAASWSDSTVDGSELVQFDFAVPYWTDGATYALWASGDDETLPRASGGLTWSQTGGLRVVWTASPWEERSANCLYADPDLGVEPGPTSELAGPWQLEANSWQRVLVRAWDPASTDERPITYLGWWIRDVTGGAWRLIGIVEVPIRNWRFTANDGGLECASGASRAIVLGERWSCREGQWATGPLTFRADAAPQLAATRGPDGRSVRFEASDEAFDGSSAWTEDATLDLAHGRRPQIHSVRFGERGARRDGSQLILAWDLLPRSAPQLAFRAEAFAGGTPEGEPLAVAEGIDPFARGVTLEVGEGPVGAIRLTILDAFGRTQQIRLD